MEALIRSDCASVDCSALRRNALVTDRAMVVKTPRRISVVMHPIREKPCSLLDIAMSNNEQGFSLIGCITTLILLGVLTTIALSVTSAFRLRAEQSTLAQSDLINASNCIEQIKSVSESHEFKSIYDSKNLKCSNATIKITPLKTTLTANNNSSNSITAKIEPISDRKSVV